MQVIELEKKIHDLKELEVFLQKNRIKPNDSLDTIVFKKYLELENVTKVAEYINELGYRKEKQKKYMSNDISAILNNKKADVDVELKKFIIKLFTGHKKGNSKRYH